ncbi:MAG: DOMON-like domain-containing protein [Candidatus Binatia bacterium]
MNVSSTPAVLACHPGTSSYVVHGIEACARWTVDGALSLAYALKGDLSRLRIPPRRPPRRADFLWQHTCFEALFSVKGKPEYYEFNFAPSGEWAAYAFGRYRDGVPLGDEELAPRITVGNAANRLDLDALIRFDHLPMIQPGAWLRLALSAVVEEEPGTLSYWALKHPPGEPDFHHPDAFVLEVEPPFAQARNENASDMSKR